MAKPGYKNYKDFALLLPLRDTYFKNHLISYFCNVMFTGIMCFLDYCCTIFP